MRCTHCAHLNAIKLTWNLCNSMQVAPSQPIIWSRNGNSARTARCTRFVCDCAHCAHQNAMKLTWNLCNPMPVAPSQPILWSRNGNSARTARCTRFARDCARCAHQITKSPWQILGNLMLIAHCDFRGNRSLLATTFRKTTSNSCKLPTKLKPFNCGPYGPKKVLFQSYKLQIHL